MSSNVKLIRRMIIAIIISSLVFIGAGFILALYLEQIDAFPFALGVILISVANVAKVFLLGRAVDKVSEIDDKNAGKRYIRFQYSLRFFFTAAALIIAFLVPFINIWGAVAGVFTFQIAAISLKFIKTEPSETEAKAAAESEKGGVDNG